MRKAKQKNNPFTDRAIDLYCQSVEEILLKINDRKSQKKMNLDESSEEAEEEEILAFAE